MQITTEILGSHPQLSRAITHLDVSTSWIRGEEGLIGFGIYKEATFTGPKRFSEASAWWKNELSALTIRNNVHGVGTGPIAFLSFGFTDEASSRVLIPAIIIGQRAGKSWITWVGEENQPTIDELKLTSPSPITLTWQPGTISNEEWKSRVATAVSKIKAGNFEKVVLARDISAVSDRAIDVRALISKLAENYPSTWVFLVSNLLGATPELLVRLSKSLVTSRVLAGTIRKTGDEDSDLALAASLAKSSKDLEEHEYAVRSVADALSPFCSSTNVPESPFVLHLANVMHLATDVTGVVNESAAPVDLFTLIAALHPSAAVCGTPTDTARDVIDEIEGMDRNRYAGPVGWIDARGDGEVGIALRCGELSADSTSILLFAGCGIVAGSDPEAELAESQAKLLPMRTALETL